LACLVEPQILDREILVLGRDYAGWSEAEARSRMQAVISRVHAASVGDKVEWNGQQRDPRYWLKNKTIIDMLGITPSEEKEMQLIISKDTKRQRDRDRKASERRLQGAKPRHEYLGEARKKRSLALDLHQQGMSLRGIGKTLGVSHTQIRRMLSTHQGR
jgi:Homeodomain-like domain